MNPSTKLNVILCEAILGLVMFIGGEPDQAAKGLPYWKPPHEVGRGEVDWFGVRLSMPRPPLCQPPCTCCRSKATDAQRCYWAIENPFGGTPARKSPVPTVEYLCFDCGNEWSERLALFDETGVQLAVRRANPKWCLAAMAVASEFPLAQTSVTFDHCFFVSGVCEGWNLAAGTVSF
mgnify:CR=1 FL=1